MVCQDWEKYFVKFLQRGKSLLFQMYVALNVFTKVPQKMGKEVTYEIRSIYLCVFQIIAYEFFEDLIMKENLKFLWK